MPNFDVIVVGAGIAGLATALALNKKGHKVTVLEQHPACQSLGGAVGLSAPATRVLIEYGLQDIMTERSMAEWTGMNFRRYDTGDVLASSIRSQTAKAYGYPTWLMARFRIQETFAEVAAKRGIEIRFNSKVISIDQSKSAVILKDGTRMEADLIVGADGYNVDIPRRLLKDDADLQVLLDRVDCWVGPLQIAIATNMPDHGDRYNICFVTEEEAGKQGEWYTLGDLESLKKTFASFEPRVQKLLSLADPKDCYIWRLSQVPPLPQWHSPDGRVVLAGDSAHAMLPYVGMGASSCIEDAACLAECLDRAKSAADFPTVLQAYEQIRKPRTEWLVKRGSHIANLWHLPDGEHQEKRDKEWSSAPLALPDRKAWDGSHIDEPPVEPQVAFDPLIGPYITGHDVIGYTQRRLNGILGDVDTAC
ncbi:hypothetical protein NQ176_g2275 [Zarea fungicola]|uniref:Uncharacterized protein n=1 Tax=Zarea fungicola TaxID=93591 RepID=A0ACC1NRL1_9HYPO|nr:hypothetical protein NQ176_g2275 [Lecanicillium fungicola]